MKIALGTTSERKKEYFEEVLTELKISAVIESFDVSSDISDQPLDSDETMQGSINRAKKAIDKDKKQILP